MRHQPDTSSFDGARLAERVRDKRGDKGLRDAARDIGGISASTLGRIEKGHVPDLDTFIRLCQWLEVSPNLFVKGVPKTEADENVSAPEAIAAHFRADKSLTMETADSLAAMVKALYNAAKKGEI